MDAVLNHHLAIIGVDADSNRIGINYFCRNTHVDLSRVILGHVILVVMHRDMTYLLVVGGQQSGGLPDGFLRSRDGR